MSFPLAGNRRIRETVEALISSKRLPHAVIIEGEAGTGKRTLARYLAKVAVCDAELPPCSVCRNCHLADTGTHPDIEVVAPEEKNTLIGKPSGTATTMTVSPNVSAPKRDDKINSISVSLYLIISVSKRESITKILKRYINAMTNAAIYPMRLICPASFDKRIFSGLSLLSSCISAEIPPRKVLSPTAVTRILPSPDITRLPLCR